MECVSQYKEIARAAAAQLGSNFSLACKLDGAFPFVLPTQRAFVFSQELLFGCKIKRIWTGVLCVCSAQKFTFVFHTEHYSAPANVATR